MYLNLIKNDIKNSKLISLTIAIFIFISALLMSIATSLFVNLFFSMGSLFEKAKTPHFMQMHSGDIDILRLENFIKDNPVIEDYQISQFLNISGAKISLSENELSHSVQDNGFTVQNEKFDFLLDLDDEIIRAKEGEVYVPIYYKEEFKLKVGDSSKIADKDFKIAGFVRDSQMNAGLVSSKRFVVSKEDFEDLKKSGNLENLIEFRLSDINKIPEIENSYINNGLESNGPPIITLKLFKLINMITDGIMISLFVMISLFIVIMSILCLRFTIIAKLNEDYQTIGTLRAIGIRLSDIKKIYVLKYVFISAIATFLGFLFSIKLKDIFIVQIQLYMGKVDTVLISIVLSFFTAFLVFISLSFYVIKGVNAFKKISPADAIRYGSLEIDKNHSKAFSILKYKLPVNSFLSIRQILNDKKLYISMLYVLVIAIFLMVLPFNMYNTIADRGFIRYMGLGDYDIRLDISQIDDIKLISDKVYMQISQDDDISQIDYFLSKSFDYIMPDGNTQKIKVELGDHSKSKIEYKKGHSPNEDYEIALSSINAKELEKTIGDELNLKVDGKIKKLIICGIYNDITNGGKTAKANFKSKDSSYLWSVMTLKLKDKSKIQNKIDEYKKIYHYKISNSKEYIDQTFGNARDTVKQVSYTSIFVALILCFVLSLLFMRMIYFKDRSRIAILRSIGLKLSDIRNQYLIKSFIITVLSVFISLILVNTFGMWLGSNLLALFGMEGIAFIPNIFINIVIVPFGVLVTVGSASVLALDGLKKLNISRFIKE